jgi:hypothetical protein
MRPRASAKRTDELEAAARPHRVRLCAALRRAAADRPNRQSSAAHLPGTLDEMSAMHGRMLRGRFQVANDFALWADRARAGELLARWGAQMTDPALISPFGTGVGL